ncbi:hypothetical protein VMCG_09861 [Cytospora schulzeri]|uniref:Uncharacterized protein n=1 Tax=Cytospora schulzeri TaxID=448051 RepID=A0A423VDS7_9PEZI|nr:hypothetical protein VMCG_09861 [Valsa malicola]
MATWLSTHGIGAIKDSHSTFSIAADAGSAIVHPTDANDTKGWIHFTIPSPPASSPNLRAVAVNFSSHSATVERVQVYLANSLVFDESNLQMTTHYTSDIASAASTVYKGKGIAVSVYVEFDNLNSKLKFQSVGVQV